MGCSNQGTFAYKHQKLNQKQKWKWEIYWGSAESKEKQHRLGRLSANKQLWESDLVQG